MENVIAMRKKRAGLIHDARAILDKAEEEKRSLTAEEEETYNRLDGEIDKLETDANRMEKQIQRERALGEPGAPPAAGDPASGDPEKRRTLGDVLQDRSIGNVRNTEEYRAAFAEWMTYGREASLTAEEFRAMQVDSDTGGGYLVAPQQMVLELLKEADAIAVIRQYARIHQLEKAASLGVPTLDKDADDWDWTAELRTGSETEIEFGKRELRPHPLAKRVKISNTLLRKAAMGPEQIVRERLAYKLGITQEKAYMTGDGVQKPLGVFTASADGISTDRDVSTGNTGTEIMPDGLIEAKYTLKQAYWSRARWIFHRDALKQIRKMKDGNGQYIWQPGISGGAPDRILELPYTASEFAPNTFSSGLYVGILGDFRYYWIVDALDMAIQRLVELYAETNQTGFIGRYEGDGMPVLEEAFVRVKLGA
jgi:HK97 family phage major capsid protein